MWYCREWWSEPRAAESRSRWQHFWFSRWFSGEVFSGSIECFEIQDSMQTQQQGKPDSEHLQRNFQHPIKIPEQEEWGQAVGSSDQSYLMFCPRYWIHFHHRGLCHWYRSSWSKYSPHLMVVLWWSYHHIITWYSTM